MFEIRYLEREKENWIQNAILRMMYNGYIQYYIF